MNTLHNSKLTSNAKALRRNMTKEERHLWYDLLKNLPITVHRQKVIGHYIVDFYVASKKTVIELDGTQHFLQTGVVADRTRDAFLESQGIKVLRYANSDVNYRFDSVCQDIWNHLRLDEV